MTDHVTLTFAGKTYRLPLVTGSEGEQAIDVSGLRAETGLITLDNGFANTGSCKSAITFLDGEKGFCATGAF
ncbi:MAG: citrate (Si)-synthase, partial [Desulfobacteraceae bacterium]